MGEAIVFTSGKGGVGKTTTIANVGAGLSLLDKKVVMLDTDMGLRNLDVVMGLEDRITYNLMDVLENHCRLNQALIKDRRYPNLYMIPASLAQKKLCDYEEKLRLLIGQLKQEFDFCLIDCPAGIDDGFHFAVSAADKAIIVTTPHISAVRDAGRVVFLLESRRFYSVELLINETNDKMVRRHDMISPKEIEEILGIGCIGCVPADDKVIVSQNRGIPVISMHSAAGRAYRAIAGKLLCPRVIARDLSREVADKTYSAPKENLRIFRRRECNYEG
jgi:septum site-determining protein MinD